MQAQRLEAHGRYYFNHGDITVARQYFGRAADLGLPIAAFRLAETHDPHELTRIGVRGLRPDPGEAKKWYERALELGIPEADVRLRRLGSR
jgi:TPR repeat protein